MTHWTCGLMAISRTSIRNYPGHITKVTVGGSSPPKTTIVVTVTREFDLRRGSITLTESFNPDGDSIEHLGPDDLPKSIRMLLEDFKLGSLEELAASDHLPVTGLYFGGHLTGIRKRD